jgi:hypothetical protein
MVSYIKDTFANRDARAVKEALQEWKDYSQGTGIFAQAAWEEAALHK